MSNLSLPERIDALLPQTQCTRCGYPTCRDYANAIAGGDADINQCPPGGADGVAALATLLDRENKPLDPTYGVEAPPIVALIDENVCIGCTKCIQACPVDAIVGAAKRMHTVIADECTGCELCIPPCPVDCIALVPTATQPLARGNVLARAARARQRFDARKARKGGAPAGLVSVGAAEAAMPFSVVPDSIAASAAPTATSTAPMITAPTTPATDVAPAESGAKRPIDRAAVLAAIARGKTRRAKDTAGS